MISFISGITLLGLPTEVYSFGIQYLYVAGAVILMGCIMANIFLPVFLDLNITSTYEVHEKILFPTPLLHAAVEPGIIQLDILHS